MATLHFICGKAGAGKTTLARELGRTLPAVVFCEDEWVFKLGLPVQPFEAYLETIAKVRAVIAPLADQLLRMGVSVVFDFAGNTVKGRRWARGLFEAAGADHVLHLIEATDAQCLAGIDRRNREQPPGIYWGPVSAEVFHTVTQYFVPPTAEEGFNVRVVASKVGGADLP